MLRLVALATLLFLSSGKTAEDGKSSCPDTWVDGTLVGMGCLYFHSDAGMTWDQADYLCQESYNGKLVSIETEAQHDFVMMMILFLADNNHAHYWWTSGTLSGTELQNIDFPVTKIF